MHDQHPPNTKLPDSAFLQGFALGVIQGRDLAREECVAPACRPAQPTTLGGDPVAPAPSPQAGSRQPPGSAAGPVPLADVSQPQPQRGGALAADDDE